ncbi:MAG TPA: hypothetical protein VND64_02075 [Pirellulales bacterium]|nr:hypothetical protein [Pirellulales bacterium]
MNALLRADDETQAAESPASVLLLTRDGLENVVRPRLTAAGADLKRVRFLLDFPATDDAGKPVTRAFEVENDLAAVEEFLAEDPGLGGFLGRKGDGEPGWQTTWRGFNKLIQALRGYETHRHPTQSPVAARPSR